MAYTPEALRYPHTPADVLLGFTAGQCAIVKMAAETMRGPRPKNQHARRAACAEAVVGRAVPYGSDPKLHRRILGAAGSYAKAMGWYVPAPQ